MKLFWMILAGVCIITAAVFMFRRDFNTAFVVAVVGMLAWFLNYRAQMKEIVNAADLKQSEHLEDDQTGEDSDEN